MDARFLSVIESLHPSFERLIEMDPVTACTPPLNIPRSGVYLFSEGDLHLYVGRSNNLRNRYSMHCRKASQHNQASFAMKLALEATKQPKASYRKGEGRKDLMLNEAFRTEFSAAKARIRAMSYRFVEESDQTRQALLELYVSIVLETPYNDFNTH